MPVPSAEEQNLNRAPFSDFLQYISATEGLLRIETGFLHTSPMFFDGLDLKNKKPMPKYIYNSHVAHVVRWLLSSRLRSVFSFSASKTLHT